MAALVLPTLLLVPAGAWSYSYWRCLPAMHATDTHVLCKGEVAAKAFIITTKRVVFIKY